MITDLNKQSECFISKTRILGVATNKDELFILEEERSVLRLSYKPEDANSKLFNVLIFFLLFILY